MMRLFLVFFVFFTLSLPAQEIRTIPDAVLSPRRMGEGRAPRDTVIGDLGQGDAPEEAYRAARNVLAAIQRNGRDSALFRGFNSIRLAELFDGVAAVSPERFRVGGGRIMPDGSVSFLFRFIGREKGVAGELYLRQDRAATPPAPASGAAAPVGTNAAPETPPEAAQSTAPAQAEPPLEPNQPAASSVEAARSAAPAQTTPPLEPNQPAASSIEAARSAAPAQTAPPLEPNQPAASS
ncbi:MAG: hypothetical protein LBC88_03950, partial [Spirochaetaceae bacterium]|nr:hypothetical protein [Spirochaetaceae bacterium]